MLVKELAKRGSYKKDLTIYKPRKNNYIHVPYSLLTSQYKILDNKAKEQIQKACLAGTPSDYIMKSEKDLGEKSPSFELENEVLTFKPRNKKKN